MLVPNLKIQRVASASLVLGGAVAGCGSDGNTAIARDLCRALSDCEGDYFDDYFDSIAECTRYYSEYLDEFEQDYGARCGRMLRSLLSCYLDAGARECVDYDELYEACEAEYNAFYNACY